MNASPKLYNSRIMRTYLEYLRVSYPDIDTQEILDNAGMTADEVEDTAHWFTQSQSDRFYTAVVEKTGDAAIARKAGRYSASSQGLSLVKQYVSGLMTTELALLSLKKIGPLLTRHATIEVKKVGPKKIEFISTPAEGVDEKPYQCENRLGTLESLPMLFSNHLAHIEHTACFHKGAPACHYLISWQNPPSSKLKLIRNFTFAGSLALLLTGFFLLPMDALLMLIIIILAVNLATGSIFTFAKTKELENIIGYRHEWAQDQIESANTRYDNSLLAQEIGQATAAIFDVKELMKKLASLMQYRLDFDRGLILLANKAHSHLIYAAGYGYTDVERKCLERTSFRLDHKESKGFFVRAFLDQKPITVANAQNMINILSPKSQDLVHNFHIRSLLCVPIIYKKTSLGILAVDNVKSLSPLKKSDVNLLEGIAAQIAISISNAVSFQKLQESEYKYRQTLESINEGYYEIDLDKNIKFANQALCTLFGCSWKELMTGKFNDFFPDDAGRQLDELFDTVRITRQPVHFSQFELNSPDKTPLPVDLSASIIIDQHGQVTGFRGIVHNATERLQLENEKKQLEMQLLQAQKMETIGTLAGGIAHNFNNWLAGILGNITLIRMDAKEHPKIVQRASRVEAIIDNAARMTQQLLGYSRTGSYEAQRLNLNRIIQEAADTFSETKKEIIINLSLEPELHKVKVDPSQIEQVFWNLFVNAIDAMPNGGRLNIVTFNTTGDALKDRPFNVVPGNYVAIEFADTGVGIDPEDMKKIFEPFFTTKVGKGTGLGLASSFGIIKAHNGYIDVTSQKGSGTTFKVFLPVVEEAPALELINRPAASTYNGSGRILLVDDEDMILETNAQLLTRLGYDVFTASDGEKALATLRDNLNSIDLVIIDMIMPGMSGKELYNRIKALRPDINTLLCSGYSLNENAQEIINNGCNGFIQKPFNVNQLSETIKRILQQDR